MAKRQGRKSAAQTPAPRKERIYGSKKNPKGSASSEKTASKIQLSQDILKGLEKKLKEFREKYPSKKNVTLADLKAVFRRGAGAYSKSHRPFITGGVPNSRNAWAYARVNKFLKKAAGQKVKAAYVQDDDLLKMEDGGLVTKKNDVNVPLYHGTIKEKWANTEYETNLYVTAKFEVAKNYALEYESGTPIVIKIDPNQLKTFIWDVDCDYDDDVCKEVGLVTWQDSFNKKGTFVILGKFNINDFEVIEIENQYSKGGLMAPNGKKSNLTPEQYKLVRTPQFKAWFGDWENDPDNASKVVDENGEPLVVYHGSDYVFNVFKTNKQIYFATSKEYASEISESGRVKSFFINIRNLLDATKFYIDDYSYLEYKTFLKKNGIDVRITTRDNEIVSKFWYLISNSSIWKSIKEKYDGFSMYENMFATKGKIEEEDFNDPFTKVYVCFEANQIKLADGTNKTFDDSNSDIRYAEGGQTFNDKELLAKWKRGESIGFTAVAHLKAKGLIPRADGTKRKSAKYLSEGGETRIPFDYGFIGSHTFRFKYLREAEDEEVENFFDSNWQEIARWSEGKGRGTTPHAIYTNGSQYLLEREDYGFDGYNSPQYYFVSINDSFAKGGEVNKLSGKITRYEDGSAWVDLYDKNGYGVGDLDIAYDTIENLLYSPYESQISKKEYYSNPQYKNLINQLKIYGLKPTDKVHYLEQIYIDDIHRGKGYASAAVNQLISFYRNKGDKYLLLTVGDSKQKNGLTPKQLIEFYSRHGFKLLKGTGNYRRRMIIDLQNKFAKGGEIDPKVLRERWAKKKDALQNLANNIQRLRTNLSKDLKEGDEKERLTALVVKVMDETGERVGNDVSADNGHFGVTGLKKKHIKINGSNLKFKYTGKSGVEHEKEINDSTLANAMREAIKNSPSEYVFETSDGFRIKNDRVNRYLNRFDVSAKDLRGYSANKWIITRLKSVKDREILGDAKKRKTKFNEIVKDVAEKVGHGRATLKKHYLLPSLEREFINHGKIVDLSNIKRTYEEGGEVNSPRSAKQQFATDLQEDKDFREAKKNAIYDERGRTYGTPNVLINDPYVNKARYKHFKINDSDINDDDIEFKKGGHMGNLENSISDLQPAIKNLITYMVENKIEKKIIKLKSSANLDQFIKDAEPAIKKKLLRVQLNPIDKNELWISLSSNAQKFIQFAKGGETKNMIALPDTYSQYERLKEILRNQGYDLTKKGMARGGDTHDEVNTGFDALANLETEPLNELADVPNDGLGIYDKGGKTQYRDGVSKLVNKESVEHLIPTFEEDDINWFKLIHSKDLINQLLENIGIPIKVKFELGEGANGTAWMTENDTVLKLTKNGAEAYSSYIIFKNQENFRSQAEIYNIFIINDYSKVDVQRIYFIEKQFLNPFQDSKASSISHIYNDIEATATATKYSNNDRLEMLENIIRDENLSEQESIYARQVFALAKDVDKEARAYGINLRDNHSGNVGFDNNGKLLCYDCAYLGNKKLNKGGNLKNENMENLKVGGEISQEEKKEIYAKWKKLVNMSKSELQKFYDSEEGKQAGLTPEEAKEAGIDSGRESARWIMKMKDTKVADWTPTMWKWAKKQISFISRMSGNKGKLVDENGKKTRKYLSLLIWGNDPKKKASGGDVEEPCHVCSMSDAQYQNLPALKEMSDGKRFVYRESVFAKGGDTMSHVGDRYLILECMGEGGITDTLNLKVIQSSSPALLVGSTINRPIRNIINKGREMGTTFGEAITGNYKKGGELNPDNKEVKNYFEHKSGAAGGLLVGKRHSEGGIKAINKSTGQPLEMEGGEVVITRDAVSDPEPVTYEGKQMTKREVLSEINQSGGGVAFADGGVIGEKTA